MPECPPRRPFRCGTMLFGAPPEVCAQIVAAWDRAERRWLAWYDQQPHDQLSPADHKDAAWVRQNLLEKPSVDVENNSGMRRLPEADAAKWRQKLLAYTNRSGN